MNFSKHPSRFAFAGMLLFLTGFAACNAPATNAPRVSFTSPSNGATVSNPVKFTMDAQNFIVEPAGTVRPGAGHLHIVVDADAVPVGQVVPKDEKHNHYGQGQKEAELTLSPGAHTVILQATDGAHVVLPGDGMMQKISITVK